jgi:hypothetical protein
MFKYILSFFVCIGLGSLTAQTFIGKLNPFPGNRPLASFQSDTIKILGVMADFLADQDGATFGNGKFGTIYSQDYGNTILDPLPHDRTYFETHLQFVKNYFAKVSRGKVAIEFFVLPDIITVSQTMRNYSPPPGSNDFTPLGNFSKEVWTIAASAFPDVNFGEYDIFTIFHAGVGRDVSLPGSIGNERDLPSVYLSHKAIEEIFNSDLTGFPRNRKDSCNSMIIPETESRELQLTGGTYLFQLSINGLLAASVASYLGLPDLFDTETGLSAIGRFGLMDGQAIFAYSGTFPPEPSAWEKIYLRWEEPVVLAPGDYDLSVVTKVVSSQSDTVILKVPINSSEYFLVENRVRDANNNGAIVTYVVDGEIKTKTFTKDTTGFRSFSVDSLAGVVIDVDEFDWAIPNEKSVSDNVYNPVPGGGIVIWHIDENVINEKISENKINTDKNKRGVDVEEADGIQDIGEKFFTIFGDEIIGEGFVEDFWYSSNPAELFKNRFSKDTRPNTNSNSGANSLITFSDFSEIGNRMTFRVSYGDSLIKPLFSENLTLPDGKRSLNVSQMPNGNFLLNLITGKNLYILDSQGIIINSVNNFSDFKTASLFWNEVNYVFGVKDSSLKLYKDGLLTSINIGEAISAPPVIVQTLIEDYNVLVGTASGKVRKFSLGLDSLSTEQVADKKILKIASDGIYYSLITSDALYDNQGKIFNFHSGSGNLNKDNNINHEEAYDLVLTKNKNGNYISIVLYAHENIFVVADGELANKFSFDADGLRTFSVTDLKKDGENYILLPNNSIEARNLTGAYADNFPFSDPFSYSFDITPLSGDFYGDNKPEIIAFSSSGNIFAIDASGRIVNSFPISSGQELACVPVLFNGRGKISLAAINTSGNLSAWSIGPTEGTFFWSEENGNNRNTSFIDAASKTNVINEFFPKARVYNYPNPVYESTTNIRYYVSEDSKVNIKIFDLAGGFVAELNDIAAGGFDNETVWNVSDIQSGIYLARIEATGSSGKTESNVIKIAIVK